MPDNILTDEMRTWLDSRMQPQPDVTLAADLHAELDLEDTKEEWERVNALVKQWREE